MLFKSLISKHIQPLTPQPTGVIPSGELHENIHAVMFDVYGTMLISGSGDLRATQIEPAVLKRLDALIRKYRLALTAKVLQAALTDAIDSRHRQLQALGREYPEIEIDQIWMQLLKSDALTMVRAFAIEYEMIVNPVYPMPHLRQVLRECRHRELALGIISNAQFYTPYMFKWLLDNALPDLGFAPELTLWSYQWGVAKPSPILFETARKRLAAVSIPPHQVLYVGNDMLNDIRPAQQVGFKTALFAGDARSLRWRHMDKRCRPLKPDLLLTDLQQLLDYLPNPS